jgi:hypothetical protein
MSRRADRNGGRRADWAEGLGCLRTALPAARLALALLGTLLAAAGGVGAQTPTPPPAPQIAAFSSAADASVPPPWRVVTLPKLPRHTQYRIEPLDGERVLRVSTEGSYANLVHPLTADVRATPVLRWRWRVGRLPEGTDLRRKDSDDVAARLCVLFDLPLERLSAGERIKVRLGRTLFDPALPAASICYVWDRDLTAGTWLPSAYTGRVQMLVLRSSTSGHPLDTWQVETRDLAADFARAFPDEAARGPLPPLLAVGVSGDGDNTGSRALAFFGDLSLSAAPK